MSDPRIPEAAVEAGIAYLRRVDAETPMSFIRNWMPDAVYRLVRDILRNALPILHLAWLEGLAPLLRSLVDLDDCWFDHHGGCQAHGYLSLEPGEICPQRELKDLLRAELAEGGDGE